MINLTTIYGSEICITPQPRKAVRQYTGFPGAHGVTAMNMGSQGRPITISGVLRASGVDYSAARATLQAGINAIESWKDAPPDHYTYGPDTYYYVVFDNPISLITEDGKAFRSAANGQVFVKFIANLRTLV